MHQSAYNLVQQAISSIVPRPSRVVDIGSFDVNGCLKPLFAGVEYTGIDILSGPNVDIVTEPYSFPFMNNSIECIVSANCMEHVSMPWRWVIELDRILQVGGHAVIHTPWQIVHHHPPDYYRYSHEAMLVLFNEWIPSQSGSIYVTLQNSIIGMDTISHFKKVVQL